MTAAAGVSTRGALTYFKACQALAMVNGRDFVAEVERRCHVTVRILAGEEDCFVRRKVMPIILELDQIKRGDAPVRRVAGDDVDQIIVGFYAEAMNPAAK